jgi:hypothetical protein
LDGDGNVDIYFVQNLFSREPETGAWDGGTSMFLRGNGDGEFQPVSSAETGLIIAGDAKGMAIADIDRDGWPDIAAAQNDDTMRVFRNQGIKGRRCIAIRLRGPRGNRDACGARVMVRLPNNRCLTAEVYAGSGYLSQSAPVVFFGNAGLEKMVEVGVRWPDGAQTTHFVQATGSQVIIEHPALSGE